MKRLLEFKGDRVFKILDGILIKLIDINNYIKDNMGEEFICKDFRIYGSNILFL